MIPSPSEPPFIASKDRPFSTGCVFWFAVIGFLITIGAFFGMRAWSSLLSEDGTFSFSKSFSWVSDASKLSNDEEELIQVQLGSTIYVLEVVRTDADRQKGLSGRDALAPQTGMLFLFESPDRHTFWMRGMRFPIDMIFLRDGVIGHIAANVQPPKTPTEEPASVRPPQIINQVIEIPAGDAKKLGLTVGGRVKLR